MFTFTVSSDAFSKMIINRFSVSFSTSVLGIFFGLLSYTSSYSFLTLFCLPFLSLEAMTRLTTWVGIIWSCGAH